MKVKLSGALAGDRFAFAPNQIIECSEVAGRRLIEHEIATEADEGAAVEGTLHDEPPEARRGAPPERTVRSAPETPEAAGPVDHCQAQTRAGNDCLRAVVPGSRFCSKHSD